jgi:glycosyltransferase involved in cell wall biosynthesis
MILFGHPTGNPNAFHAALAHFEMARLEAICIPWMPSRTSLAGLRSIAPLRSMAQRLGRRHFAPLRSARKVQGRFGEIRRLITRAIGRGDESLSYLANDWLMATMAHECTRAPVTAVHAFEDCSLWQFVEAKNRGKACIYDMPIGYYPTWERQQDGLARRYADWLPADGLASSLYARPDQKRREMVLADLVLAPSDFVEETIRAFHPDKPVARAPYGVDLEFWSPAPGRADGPLRFIYAGQLSIRKDIPGLIAAWERAALRDAELELVGSWHLAERKRTSLPRGVTLIPQCSPQALRNRYRAADALVFPSWFEGLSLVLLEAMACGLPVIASRSSGGGDVVTPACGRLIEAGDTDALVETLRWFAAHRDQLSEMGAAARRQAEMRTWDNYGRHVAAAVAPFV